MIVGGREGGGGGWGLCDTVVILGVVLGLGLADREKRGKGKKVREGKEGR